MGKHRTVVFIVFAVFAILVLLLTGILLAVKTMQTSHDELVTLMRKVNTTSASGIRLPRDLVPFLYDIHIFTSFNASVQPNEFNGTCKVSFSCANTTRKLVLHTKKLDVDSASIVIFDLTDGVQLKYSSTSYNVARQFFIVNLLDSSVFRAGHNYTVFMRYRGLLLDDTSGFYRAGYVDNATNSKKWLLASQMQPTDARKAFPCFDEPWMKAKFKLTVVHHKSLFAISNMPVVSTTSVALNLTETSFEESVRMSTYLIALVISDYKCKYATAKAGPTGSVNVSVCGYASAYNQFDFALKNLVELLEKYEKRFEIKYPLTKCDNVGLPDFLYLGMENFGLITYRETHLFTPDRNTTGSYLTTPERLILDVLVHEIVHMWFGNIVTPEWWDDLWLSEGFATFLQLENYGMMLLNSLFGIDSLSNSYSIYMDIVKMRDTEQIFNEMTYVKASIVVRLLKFLVGEKTFDKFVLKYLYRHQYGNVNQFHLYDVIQEEINKQNDTNMPPIANFIQTWTKQNGHPVVHVKTLNSSAIVLSQERFLVDPSVIENKPKHKWYISFTYDILQSANATNETALDHIAAAKAALKKRTFNITWLTPNEEQKIISLPKRLESDEIIIGNLELSGFYRVNYDAHNWDKILKQLKNDPSVIPYENRVQIMNDMFSFGRNGILEVTKPLELLDYLKNDPDSYLWRTVGNHLREIYNMLQSSDTLKDYQAYMFKIFKASYTNAFSTDNSKNFEKEIALVSGIFPFASQFSCDIGYRDCIELSKVTFALAQKGINSTGNMTDLPEFIICTGIKYGSSKDWEFVSKLHDQLTDAFAKKTLQHTLACTRDMKLLERYLEDQINEKKTKRYDCLHGISTAAKPHHNNAFVWNFVKKNWPYIYKRFGHSNIIEFNHFISTITDGFHTQEQLNDFIQFFIENPDHDSIARQVTQSIEKVKSVLKWRSRNMDKLSAWFKTRKV